MKRTIYRSCLFLPLLLCLNNWTFGQIIINEIMPNPNNAILPQHEYIELFNNSNTAQQLQDYTLHIGNNTIQFPSYNIAPYQYTILCSPLAATDFSPYGNILPIDRWYPLNNSSATLSISIAGNTIDIVNYTSNWFKTAQQRSGGWSLERINPDIACNTEQTWLPATNTQQGTPGRPNTSLNKTFAPDIHITSSEIIENKLILYCNTTTSLLALNSSSILISPQIGTGQLSKTEESITITYEHKIPTNTPLSIKFQDVYWCNTPVNIPEIVAFQQAPLQYNDIIINEILFNPKEGGVDFVELYNQTNFPINLQRWKLGNFEITDHILLIEPQQHIAFSTNAAIIQRHYASSQHQTLFQVERLPAYPNQQGIVTLYSPDQLIDSLYYTATMHSPFLRNPKGISLERQSAATPTNQIGNFSSASTLTEATPGYVNSSQTKQISTNNKLFLSSKTVSPDNDGYEDNLEINYETAHPDAVINLSIYNQNGQLIKQLLHQQTAGKTGQIKWDCRHKNGTTAPSGIYICLLEIYQQNGKQNTFKQGFVITRQRPDY